VVAVLVERCCQRPWPMILSRVNCPDACGDCRCRAGAVLGRIVGVHVIGHRAAVDHVIDRVVGSVGTFRLQPAAPAVQAPFKVTCARA